MRRGQDSSIVIATAVANDFVTFFAGHARFRAVLFNGRTAKALWTRHLADKQQLRPGLVFDALPSASPANAQLALEGKAEVWRASVVGCGRWR